MDGIRLLSEVAAVLVTVMMLLGSAQGVSRYKDTALRESQADVGPTERGFPETLSLDRQMSTFLRANRYAGATLGVAHNDEVIYTQGYGQTSEGAVMRPTTMQPISSLSKTLTAVAVLILIQRGDLSLTDGVFGPAGILSAVRPLDGMDMDPRLPDITVEHLLHHSAGWSPTRPRLYDPLMNSVYLSRGHDVIDIAEAMGLNRDLTPHDVITYMIGQPLARPPGIEYEYSNFGYSVLGRVVEQVSGEKYASFVRSHILEPLGMWQTRIGNHRLAQTVLSNHIPVMRFPEGDIPLSDRRSGSFYTLCDSTLGWWSTVYDLMRFVTGLTSSGMLLNPETLTLLTRHPDAPVSEHRDTWHGLGVRTDEETWWQLGDPHDNEIILFHQKTPTPPKSRQSKIRKPQKDSWSWVVLLSDNNRKDLKRTFSRMMSSVAEWPIDNLLIEDCGEYLARGSWKHSTLMNSQISENHFPILLNAASRLHYYPFWISAYNVHHKTYLSAVFKRDSEDSYRIAHGITKLELLDLRADNFMDGFFLNFVTSYNSYRSDGDIRYVAIFSETPSQNTKFGIGETLVEFSTTLNEGEGNYWPTSQSVASLNGVRQFTYSLSDKKVHSWKSFDNLTLEQLELQIRLNANMDRVLSYLDSYSYLGKVLFSAVFSPGQAGHWQVQAEVQHHELSWQSYMFRGLHFRPRIMVGYECKGQACFVIKWKKHVEY